MTVGRALLLIAVLAGAFLFWSGERAKWPIRNSPAGEGPIVAFGDSLTRGHGLPADQGYPALLGQLLGKEVVNLGRDGDTSQTGLERIDEVLGLSPTAVIITLGGNDILRRLPVEDTVRSLREIFTRILDSGAIVVFVAIDPPFVSGDRMDRVRELSRELGVLHLDSVMDGLWGSRDLMLDRIHPNAAGYRLMAERVREALRPHL